MEDLAQKAVRDAEDSASASGFLLPSQSCRYRNEVLKMEAASSQFMPITLTSTSLVIESACWDGSYLCACIVGSEAQAASAIFSHTTEDF